MARALLTRLGHRPTIAANGEAVVESWLAARAADSPYDLVFMDMQMPGMAGLEAARRIRAAEAEAGDKRTRMLALTANTQTEDREAALTAGLDGLQAARSQAVCARFWRPLRDRPSTRLQPDVPFPHCHNSLS